MDLDEPALEDARGGGDFGAYDVGREEMGAGGLPYFPRLVMLK